MAAGKRLSRRWTGRLHKTTPDTVPAGHTSQRVLVQVSDDRAGTKREGQGRSRYREAMEHLLAR